MLKILIYRIYTYACCHLFFFIKLNDSELNGDVGLFTKLKFCLAPVQNFKYVNGRTIRGVKFDVDLDPYVKAFNIFYSHKSKDSSINSLEESILSHRNLKISDFNSFSNEFAYCDFPIYAMVYPWDSFGFDFLRESYNSFFQSNRSNFTYYSIDLNSSPLSISTSHINQFQYLLDLITLNGYQEICHSLPCIYILLKDDKWYWIMSNAGNHRAVIRFVLCYDYIKANTLKIIDYNKLYKCKNVKNSNYSIKDAQRIFNKVITGLELSRSSF